MTRRRLAVTFLCVLAVAAAIAGFVGLRETATSTESARPIPVDAEPPRPTRVAAVRAATDFLTALDLARLLDDHQRRRWIRAAAAPGARASLQLLYAEEKHRVAASYRAGPRFARAALAGYRIDEFAPPGATVSIWAATLGGSGSYAPTAGWSTTTVSLAWKQSSWKVTDVRSSAGPGPDWPSATLAVEGSRFQEYRHAP